MPLRAGVDGGVSDNLGLRGMIEAFQEIEAVSQLLQSSSVPSDHFSFDSVELLSNLAQHRANQRQLDVALRRIGGMLQAAAEAGVPTVSFDAIDVSFGAIADPTERSYFMILPTSDREGKGAALIHAALNSVGMCALDRSTAAFAPC